MRLYLLLQSKRGILDPLFELTEQVVSCVIAVFSTQTCQQFPSNNRVLSTQICEQFSQTMGEGVTCSLIEEVIIILLLNYIVSLVKTFFQIDTRVMRVYAHIHIVIF